MWPFKKKKPEVKITAEIRAVKSVEVAMHPDVEDQVSRNPDMARAIDEFKKVVQRAVAGVNSGKYKDMDDAMRVEAAMVGGEFEITEMTSGHCTCPACQSQRQPTVH